MISTIARSALNAAAPLAARSLPYVANGLGAVAACSAIVTIGTAVNYAAGQALYEAGAWTDKKLEERRARRAAEFQSKVDAEINRRINAGEFVRTSRSPMPPSEGLAQAA